MPARLRQDLSGEIRISPDRLLTRTNVKRQLSLRIGQNVNAKRRKRGVLRNETSNPD